MWLSILYQSSNSYLEIENTDSKTTKISKIKSSKHENERDCFPIITTNGSRQCYNDQCISNCEVNPPNSVLVSVILSPNICKVNIIIIL